MQNIRFLHALLLAAIVIIAAVATANSAKSNSSSLHAENYERHARDILEAGTKRMQSIWKRKRDIFLSLTQGRGYNVVNHAPIKQEIEKDYRHLVYELARNLSVIPARLLRNVTVRRQVQRLAKLQLHGLREPEYEQAKEMLHTMQTFITTRLVCHVTHNEDCTQTIAMMPGIVMHSMRSKKVSELEYYWQKWRQALSDKGRAKTAFIEYVRLLRLAAAYNGHVTPSRTWYLNYDTDNFQRELEDVIWEVMPLYQELHAYLRHSVRLAYGEHVAAEDGTIPAPVMEQIIHQAWVPNAVFRIPYPKNHLPTVKQRLEEVLITPIKINKKAAEFFESLGLNQMSDAFYKNYSRRISDAEIDPDCHAEVYYFPPDVGLRYCNKLDYKKLLQIHGVMAELQYNLYRKELPFGLDREPCPGFASAIGEAAVVASGTPRHLNRLHILYNNSLDEEQSMNRLFRMGVHTILAIPQYFISEKLLVDIMDGRIGANEYNCGYWRLQYKYAGVGPSVRRSEKTFDPDYKFYKGLNPENPTTVKLISEILGYQFYRAFCLASGQYRPGDHEYPLHNCDFYGSTEAGELMKKMMQLGATQHWRDIMEIATGERKLSGKGVMEYFAPLFTWLKEQNNVLGAEPGWDADINCKNE